MRLLPRGAAPDPTFGDLPLVEHPTHAPRISYAVSPLRFVRGEGEAPARPLPAWDLVERLAYGSLPGVVTADPSVRADLLRSYSQVRLEEEIRREALVKDWGAFVRFVQLAALESGQVLNYAGISQPTVKAHYQLLEDIFVGFRVPAFTRCPRKNLLSTPKFFFFDLGVRHGVAGLKPSADVVLAGPGPLFEQWVGIELWKRLRYLGEGKLHHLRTKAGAQVDFIIECGGELTPVEVKWTERPTPQDARHVRAFLDENPGQSKHYYVVCRCLRPLRLDERITALPWFCL